MNIYKSKIHQVDNWHLKGWSELDCSPGIVLLYIEHSRETVSVSAYIKASPHEHCLQVLLEASW